MKHCHFECKLDKRLSKCLVLILFIPITLVLTRIVASPKSSIARSSSKSFSLGFRVLKFYADGRGVIAVDVNGNIFLWDTATGKRLNTFLEKTTRDSSVQEFPYADRMHLHCGAVTSDGKRVFLGGYSGFEIWDFSPEKTFIMQEGAWSEPEIRAVYSMALSPNGKYLLMGCETGDNIGFHVELRRISTGKRLWIGHRQKESITVVAFSPDSRRAMTGDEKGIVTVWNVKTGKAIQSFLHPNREEEYNRGVAFLTFSPHSKYALSGGYNNRLRVWSPRTGKMVREFNVPAASAAVTQDEKKVIIVGKQIEIREIATGQLVCKLQQGASSVLSPDGRYSLTSDDRQISLWEIKTGRLVRQFTRADEE